jgi:hypothetical protein
MTASNTRRIHVFLVLPCVSYLASHAAALSFNYSGSPDYPGLISRRDAPLAINTTAGISSVLAAGLCYCEAWREGSDADPGHVLFNIGEVDSSTSSDRNYYVSVGGQSSALFALKQLVNCSSDLAFLIVQAFQESSFELGLSCSGGSLGGLELRSLPGYTSTRGIGRVPRSQSYRALYSHRLRDQPTARRLLSSTYELNATTQPRQVASSWIEQVSVAGSALVGLICAVAGLLLCCIRSKRPRQKISDIELEEDDDEIIMEHDFRHGVGPRRFRYGELAAATNNFAAKRKIGRGGFGPVYRGYLSEEGRPVAIKALSQELSVQGLKEFQAEVTIMTQLRHRYVVQLVGWCARRRGLALVYELMSGGSLDTLLYSPDRHLTWPERYSPEYLIVNSLTELTNFTRLIFV